MDKENFIKVVEKEAEKIEIKLDKMQVEKFYNYMEILLQWNEVMNLTAITEPKDIIVKHFIDSLTIAKYIDENCSVVDIGTGAGFPGLPIKIAKDDIELTLVDSLNKRINFLKKVVENIELKKVVEIHCRAEEFGKNKKYRENFDVAVSRAVARLNILVEYLLPAVKIGGKCICMKGPGMQDEIEEAKNAINLLGGEIADVNEFTLPGTDIKRTVIIINKVKNTPARFPRKAGTPSKEPLK